MISEMSSSRFLDYSRQSVQDLVNRKLLKMTEELVNLGSCIDLQEMLIWFTFDNICTMAFGIDLGFLSIDLQEVSFARAFEEAT